MKLVQIRHCYECTLEEAKKIVLEKYPEAVVDHSKDDLKNANIYKDDVWWVKNKEDLLKDRYSTYAIAIFKKQDEMTEQKINKKSNGVLELYDICEY